MSAPTTSDISAKDPFDRYSLFLGLNEYPYPPVLFFSDLPYDESDHVNEMYFHLPLPSVRLTSLGPRYATLQDTGRIDILRSRGPLPVARPNEPNEVIR